MDWGANGKATAREINRQQKVQVEISVETLEALFLEGKLCAAKLNCLNMESKQAVQSLCLKACVQRFCQPDDVPVKVSVSNHIAKSKRIIY
ncbi:hypothetical protein SAMN02745132_04715 [Enterovibrio nigricans DSM 22720]|uniref:Uncharacterized protein n=1 Tax=Enterovibrio nigricans DSM 22720 TaxID=1121868 RepID=A0A1T4W437_9GAMM|nr:hypothetical protein [Enterovibrio nigricans]SKA71818.1 hypothetical protein SAMN02745132_04715 [Enterovibrio nigricans DSM 22720]